MLFNKRSSELTPEDIRRIEAEKVPEGSEVEFKKGLSTRDGRDHPWETGGEIGEHARNKLLPEVVAFSNTYGGWLLVGIDQTEEKPSRANAVVPIRACADLAERLRLMCRDCIDPRLPVLEVEGVPLQEDGAGVVVFHVPRSRMAPHRLTPTNACYRRHGDRTEEMDMREIQDLTLQVERGMAAVDRRFKERQDQFERAFKVFKIGGGERKAFGIRATLVPLTPIHIDRVHGKDEVRPPVHEIFCTAYGGHTYKLSLYKSHVVWRPTIRGSVCHEGGNGYFLLREVYCEGLLEYGVSLQEKEEQGGPLLYLTVELVIAVFCNALCAAEMFRRGAGAPDIEYGLEFAIANGGAGDLNVSYYGNPYGELGPFPKGHTIFPRYSIGRADEFQGLAQVFERDFWDAVGFDPPSLARVDFDRAFRELGLVSDQPDAAGSP
jgi:Putative DNA-binding domain